MLSGFRSLAATIVAGLADCAVIILCLPCYLALRRRQRASCVPRSRPRQRRSPPQTLPTTRLDIRQLAIAGKPQACQFFGLPLELQQCIYDEVLGGRVVHLELVPSPGARTTVVGATFYQPVDHPNYDPQRLDMPAESVSTAVLFCCRQMYLESQLILYQRNTFYVSVTELEMVVLIGLGSFCLPDIRSLYLYHSYRTTTFAPPWATVFALLQQMHLKQLVFEFEIYTWTRWTQYNPRIDVLNDTWARSVLGIRTLSQFGLFLKDLNLQDVYRPNVVHSPDVTEEFRKLMIGSRAEESYRDYLEK